MSILVYFIDITTNMNKFFNNVVEGAADLGAVPDPLYFGPGGLLTGFDQLDDVGRFRIAENLPRIQRFEIRADVDVG